MRRITNICLQIFLLAYLVMNVVIYSCYYNNRGKDMTENIIILLTALTAIAGLATTIISQILFYRKDSKSIEEVKTGVSLGNKNLHDQIENRQENLIRDHKEINEIVREIRTRQEQELKLQEKIMDAVPDEEFLKAGIDKICRENVALKDEIRNLQHQVAKLEEQNRKLVKTIKKERTRTEELEL